MRGIRYDPAFDKVVERLGGYLLVDEAPEPILDGLCRYPWGLPCIENDWIRIRYVITKPTEALPALLVTFRIETDNDVTMLHAEGSERYDPHLSIQRADRDGQSRSQGLAPCREARTLSLSRIMRMSNDEARDTFNRVRWSANGGEPFCPPHVETGRRLGRPRIILLFAHGLPRGRYKAHVLSYKLIISPCKTPGYFDHTPHRSRLFSLSSLPRQATGFHNSPPHL
jgi:hypothetical protein